MDTRQHEVNHTQTRLDASGVLHTDNSVQAVDAPLNSAYMEELAFMEEEIEIMVQETADENAENPVAVGVNGQFRYFLRGVPTRCKRKFADQLFAKQMRVTTPRSTNQATGEEVRLIKSTMAQKYPFQTIEDRNPKGSEWVWRRMAEAF